MIGPDEFSHDDRHDDLGDEEPAGDQGVLNRRRFLAGAATLGVFGGTMGWMLGRTGSPVAAPAVTTAPATTAPVTATTVATAAPAALTAVDALPGLLVPAPVDQRILVLIELEGGNDGLSTLVPAGSGTYYDLRSDLAVAEADVLALDDDVGLNPHLARLHRRQMAVVEGVGPVDGSLSHFAMADRWAVGDPSGRATERAGFLARLADQLDNGGISVGLSVSGSTPRFAEVRANTLSLDEPEQLWVLTDDEWIYPSYRRAIAGITGGPLATAMARSWGSLFAIGDALPADITGFDKDDPMIKEGRDIGRALATAAAMIRADIGVRVIHARMGGFDTHEGHRWRHEDLMSRFDLAVDGFMAKLREHGLADRVLVATTSEFGRRVRQNGSGFDHGNASTMMLFGPVVPGRYGEAPRLDDLDPWGGLKTTVPFDVHLGTLAQVWLGVEAASVLPSGPEVLPILG